MHCLDVDQDRLGASSRVAFLSPMSHIANEPTTEDFYVHMECHGPFPLYDTWSQCSMNDV